MMLKELTVEINRNCPNNCLFCSSEAVKKSSSSLGIEDVLSIGRQAHDLGLQSICLSGGEPLLHPDVYAMIAGLTCLNLNVVVYTTGACLLDWSVYQQLSPKFIFNLQSTDASIHDILAGRRGAFDQTKLAILEAKKYGYSVEVHIVPNKLNISTLEATVKELDSWDIEQVSFLKLVWQGNANRHVKQLYLDEDDMITLEQIFFNLRGYRIRLGTPFAKGVCKAGNSKLLVRWDGIVFPCEAFKSRPEFAVGSIYQEGLDDLLEKGRNNVLLENLKRLVQCPAQAKIVF